MSIEDASKTPDTSFLPLQVKMFGTHLDINDINDIFNMLINFHAYWYSSCHIIKINLILIDNKPTKTWRSMFIPIYHHDNNITISPQVYFSLYV